MKIYSIIVFNFSVFLEVCSLQNLTSLLHLWVLDKCDVNIKSCENLCGVTYLSLQVDKVTGRVNGQFKTYAICGAIRRMVSIFLTYNAIVLPFILISKYFFRFLFGPEAQSAFSSFWRKRVLWE